MTYHSLPLLDAKLKKKGLFLAALSLHCCERAFSSCREQGPLLVVVQRLLTTMVSLAAWSTGSRHRGISSRST